MKKQRLYHSQFNHHGFRKTKGAKSRAHSLRAENALLKLYKEPIKLKDICSPELIKNNLVWIDGKKVNSLNGDQLFDTITKSLEVEKKEYLEKINNAYTDSDKAKLSDKRAKAKASLKRYADGSDDLEKDFWINLKQKLGNEEIDPENEILDLKKTTDGKIKRFNQKIKRINELKDYNSLVGVKSRNTAYTIFSKEILYKIPDDTELSIKPMDFANFANSMNKKLFPDFKVNYLLVHCDENEERPHVHCEFSGKNKNTDEMDIQQQLFLNLEKQYKLNNKPFPFEGRSYNGLDFEEVKQFGETYQDFIFEEMNQYLNKKGYDAKLEKRTEQEVKEQNKQFLDQHKPTQNREWTRAKKLQEKNTELKSEVVKSIEQKNKALKTVKELNKNVEDLEINIENKNEELINVKRNLKIEYEKLSSVEKLTINAKSALQSAIDFAKNPQIKSLEAYKEHFQGIRDDVVADKIKTQSIKIQPTEDQEIKIKNNSRRGRNRS